MRFIDLQEGPNDPGIFKAVFLAGGPGSGKGYVAQQLGLQSRGLKVINSDDAFEYLMRKRGLSFEMPPEQQPERDVARQRAKDITNTKQDLFLDGRLGLIIDGTAKDVSKMAKLKIELEAIGYQTMMVFVNTNLKVALQRNLLRDRKVPSDIVIKSHKQVQDNKNQLAEVFGENFVEVINEENPDFNTPFKRVDKFLAAPITAQARDWVSKAQLQKSVTQEDSDSNTKVIYQLDKSAPMDDTEVLVIGGAGRYSLAGLRNKARKEAEALAKDLEIEHGGAFRRAAQNVKQFSNTLNTVVAAYDELNAIRRQGGSKSKGIRNEDAQGKPKVYVDMDGVLANFYAGITRVTGHEEPRDMALQDIEDTMASFKGTDFFYKLPKYEQTDQLIAMVHAATGGDWYILSSPLKYDREGSAKYKAAWIRDKLKIQPKDMHFTGDKAQFATQPDGTPNILIDDYPKYLNSWKDKGGIGVQYKGHAGNIEDVKATLDQHFGAGVDETIRKVQGGYRLLSKKGKNLGTYPSKAGAEKRERQVQYFKHESTVREEVTQSNLDEIERYADKLFSTLGIDVNFTRHFIDRVNDPRNVKPITPAELTRLFKQEFKRWGKPIAQMGPDAEAVMKDMQTDINMPFVLKWDRDTQELDLVAKTIMRKQDFKSPDPVFPVENKKPGRLFSTLSEIADSPYEYVQNVKTPDKRAYRFQTDAGQLYRVQVFNRRSETENKLEIHFDLTDMKTGKPETGVTGTGDAVRVFSTVANILKQEVAKQDPTGVIIASKADDESRVKLYRTLARRATKLMPGYEVSGERTVTGASGDPYLTIELKKS
jgi:cytidylate kinase